LDFLQHYRASQKSSTLLVIELESNSTFFDPQFVTDSDKCGGITSRQALVIPEKPFSDHIFDLFSDFWALAKPEVGFSQQIAATHPAI